LVWWIWQFDHTMNTPLCLVFQRGVFMEVEEVPPYLAPVLIGDRGTPAWFAVVQHARRLQRYPLDIAERLGVLALAQGQGNPRDINAAVWIAQHPTYLQEGGRL
jgi:hypothetical protein